MFGTRRSPRLKEKQERVSYKGLCLDRRLYCDYRDNKDCRRPSSTNRNTRKRGEGVLYDIGANKENIAPQELVIIDRNMGVNMAREPPKKRHRKSQGWGNKRKSVNKSWKEQQELRVQERLRRYKEYYEAVKSNIYDMENRRHSMSPDEYKHMKKYMVVKLFYTLLKPTTSGADISWFNNKTDVYKVIEDMYEVTENTARRYISEYEDEYDIKRSWQGKHAKTVSGLVDVVDRFRLKCWIDEKINNKE